MSDGKKCVSVTLFCSVCRQNAVCTACLTNRAMAAMVKAMLFCSCCKRRCHRQCGHFPHGGDTTPDGIGKFRCPSCKDIPEIQRKGITASALQDNATVQSAVCQSYVGSALKPPGHSAVSGVHRPTVHQDNTTSGTSSPNRWKRASITSEHNRMSDAKLWLNADEWDRVSTSSSGKK